MKEEFITIENESKIYQIKEDDILSVSVDSKIVTFELEDNRKISKYSSLCKIIEEFPKLTRIDKNCAVNSDKIIEIMKKENIAILSNKKKYHVSRRNIYKFRSWRKNDR